jgi:xylulokinase
MTDKLILALDLGTSGAKVALIAIDGRVLGWESESIPLHALPGGGAEQNPNDWWNAFVKAAQRLLGRNLAPKESIAAICCSTQGEGTIAVDRDGNALMNGILWLDMRGAPYLRKQVGGLINIDDADIFKVLRWIALTGGMPSVTGKDPAAHMLFIRDVFPQIYEKTYKFLNVLDYMNLRLTGRFTATFDSILTSWVTDNRDPNDIRYSRELIGYSGIDADKFPDIVACTAELGTLAPAAASALGLGTQVKVVAGSIDVSAAAIGSGAVADAQPHLYIGTSSWIAAHVPYKKTDIGSHLASVPCALPGHYLLIATQETAGGNLSFLRDNILYHKDELLAEAKVPDVFKIFDTIAARVPPGSNGVMYAPWLWGERAPVDNRHLRAGLFNISYHNTREDIIRAFLEGVAYNERWLMAPVEKFLGRKVEEINLVGGGGNSDVWSQIFADVLNVRVRQVQDSIQANARGAAWIAAAALGEIKFNDIPQLVPIKRTYEPGNRTLYDERFTVFVEVYKQMKGIYAKLNR